jgi:serine/threonine protein kinase
MKLPVGTALSKYLLLKYEGGGSFGDVYQAEDRATSSICALKCIEVDPTFPVALVLQEARNLKACQSQHIVEIASADVFDLHGVDLVLIDMEYLPQGSLESKIEKSGISYEEALCANRHMLLGLSAAHKKGIIHKDVKPANIMICGSIFKLSDFGVSYVKATSVGIPLTYEPNAAPELLNGNAPDEQTDVYAAGVTLYRSSVLSGPTSIDPSVVFAWDQSGRSVGLPEYAGFPDHCPRRLKTVILRATAAKPADRYASVEEMLSALEKLKVAIPWRIVSDRKWEADVQGKLHVAEVVRAKSQWEVKYTIDGRRRSPECSVHSTEKVALKRLSAKIAKTTLV